MVTRAFIVTTVALALMCGRAHAQYALFTRETDTIQIAGRVILGGQATYEARVLPTSNVLGKIYNEWHSGQDDKQLRVSKTGISAYAFPINNPVFFDVPATLSGYAFQHVAYVYDGAEERIYLDGVRIATRPGSGSVGNWADVATSVGALFRDGYAHPAFLGYMDTLRVSNVARYSGASFVPPPGDLSSDANTMLLYNFNEKPGSATITDSSGEGHTGTPGVGFTGATSPRFGVSALLVQNQTDRRIAVLLMAGASVVSSKTVTPTLPVNWRFAALADFDNDGQNDIVAQNTQTRAISILFLAGTSIRASVPVNPTLPPGWSVMAAADVSLDDKPDIIVQNASTQQIAALHMDGAVMLRSKSFSQSLAPNWSIVGAADFNDDGWNDLAVQNSSTRQIAIVTLLGQTVTGSSSVSPTLPEGWTVGAVGDYDGNGLPDLVVQNGVSGRISVLAIVNRKIVSSTSVTPAPPLVWKLVGPK
jgi:hypothetical protein